MKRIMRKACSLLPVSLSGALGHRRMMSMLTALLLFAHSGITLALTCQSNATGNWNVAGTWTTCGGGIPGAGDDVQIRDAYVVTIPAGFAAAANSVTFTASNGAARLDHAAASSTLAVGAGGVTFNAPGNNNTTRSWNINAGSATVNGALGINDGGNNNSRIARIQITTGSLDVNGNLTMTAGNAVRTVIDMSGGAGNLFVAGSFSLASGNGTLTPGTSSTVTLDSATTPVTVATGSSIAYHHLVIAKGAGNVANAATTGALTVGGNLTVTSGTFNIPGITATVTGETNVSGTLAFITSAAGTKTFTGNVTINSGGFWTNNTVNSPVTLRGHFTNNGTFAAGTGVYTFSGTSAQSITGTNAGTTTFGSLTLNNANGLTLSGAHNVTVSNVLALTNGVLTTGGNVLSVTNSAAGGVTRSSGFVDGSLTWALPTGDPGVRTFPLGTGTTYSPAALTFTGVTTGGNITARAIAGDHPDVANSGVNEGLSVNRYWSVSNSGVAFANYDAVFTWVAGDLDVGADTNVFEAQRLDGTWNATTPGTRTATSIQVTGLAGFGDFAIGQPFSVSIGTGRFNAYDTTTAGSPVSGFIMTKVAGSAFNVDIIAISNNRKSIQTNYNGTVRVELLNASDNSGTPDASTGCNSSWTVIQTIAPDLVFVGADNGRKPITVTENNAWREARFRITEQPGGTLIGCSTDAFAIRPASIVVSATDADWATAGSGRTLDNGSATGGNVHRAGRPFTINVGPSPVSATNYDGTPTVNAVACTLPGGCVNGTFDIGTFAGSGSRVSDTASYSEAGVFNLTLIDETYTLIDATDGTPADCSAAGRLICQSAAPLAVGRFVPDRFEFSAPSTPMLLTFGENACATRSFTYVGQPFWYNPLMPPSATLQAVNAAGVVTANYPLNTATLRPAIGESYVDAAAPVAAPLDVSAIGSPAATSGAGSGTYTASTAGQLRYDRTTPVVPFNAAIGLTVTATDSTESAVAGNGTISAASPLVFDGGGTGIAFDAGSEFRYGRLRLTGASGLRNLPLQVPFETQHWTGMFFATNILDTCTALISGSVALGNNIGSITTSVVAVSALTGGRGAITLAAPDASGSVDVSALLGPSAAICPVSAPQPGGSGTLPWLRGQWCGAAYDRDPTVRARFGIRRGSDEQIYMRENYQ